MKIRLTDNDIRLLDEGRTLTCGFLEIGEESEPIQVYFAEVE